YTLNLYDVLCNYIKSADYQLDNNRIERINRYISLSRRNSLFAGSHAEAQRMALFYSLACSARLHNLNTFDYFTDLFNRLADIQPTAQDSVFRNLLPDKWIPCH
ncbi:IS66 family transposase, partial [Parabacteroides sp.]